MEIARKQAVRSVFTVKQKVFITPHYIRVIFNMTYEQAELFGNVRIGANNKVFVPLPGTDSPVMRTYTTRHIDYINKELWVDFVAHGDNGPASYWANRATTGSELGIAMKEGVRPLFPDADEYLLVGDSTALPVIGAMLEQLPAHARVKAILEAHGEADELELQTKAELSIQWVHNAHPENGSSLAELVKGTNLPKGRRFVFVAGEYETIKVLKNYFREELAWPANEYSIVSYWKRGESEDQSSVKRREERSS